MSVSEYAGYVRKFYIAAECVPNADRWIIKGEPDARHCLGSGESQLVAWRNAADNIRCELIEPDSPRFRIDWQEPHSGPPVNADYFSSFVVDTRESP